MRKGSLRVIVAPTPTQIDAIAPVAELRRHANISHTDFDPDLVRFASTAFHWLHAPAGWLGRSLIIQRLRLDLPCWPSWGASLPAGPIGAGAISSVKFFDTANAEQVLPPAQYFQDEDNIVWSQVFSPQALYPRPGAVRIEYDAGYATAAELPPTIKQAILMLVAHWHENRDAVATAGELSVLPIGVQDVLMPWKQW